MSNENQDDDTSLQNDTQQQQQQDDQNNDTQQQQQDDKGKGEGSGADWLDKQLDTIEADTRKSAGKTVDGEGKGSAAKGNDGKDPKRVAADAGKGPNTQQQRQGDGERATLRQTTPQTRNYGTHFRSDVQGNIVDARGQLVAKTGGERAMFHKLYPLIDTAQNEAASLKTRLDNYENANAIAKKEGLSIDEQGAALTLMVQWKKNPAETIKTMLRLAGDRGIDTNDIVQGGGGFNQAAVLESLDQLMEKKLERFGFLVQQQEQSLRDTELHDTVVEAYNSFMEQFPDAKVHEESLANIMRDKNVDHEKAYFIARTFAAENGLDWTKPLKEQILAKQQGGNGRQQQRPSGGGNNRELPDMSGRTLTKEIPNGSKRKYADVNDSYGDIAQEVMREFGLGGPS